MSFTRKCLGTLAASILFGNGCLYVAGWPEAQAAEEMCSVSTLNSDPTDGRGAFWFENGTIHAIGHAAPGSTIFYRDSRKESGEPVCEIEVTGNYHFRVVHPQPADATHVVTILEPGGSEGLLGRVTL